MPEKPQRSPTLILRAWQRYEQRFERAQDDLTMDSAARLRAADRYTRFDRMLVDNAPDGSGAFKD
jgi:hypothetical protein